MLLPHHFNCYESPEGSSERHPSLCPKCSLSNSPLFDVIVRIHSIHTAMCMWVIDFRSWHKLAAAATPYLFLVARDMSQLITEFVWWLSLSLLWYWLVFTDVKKSTLLPLCHDQPVTAPATFNGQHFVWSLPFASGSVTDGRGTISSLKEKCHISR